MAAQKTKAEWEKDLRQCRKDHCADLQALSAQARELVDELVLRACGELRGYRFTDAWKYAESARLAHLNFCRVFDLWEKRLMGEKPREGGDDGAGVD